GSPIDTPFLRRARRERKREASSSIPLQSQDLLRIFQPRGRIAGSREKLAMWGPLCVLIWSSVGVTCVARAPMSWRHREKQEAPGCRRVSPWLIYDQLVPGAEVDRKVLWCVLLRPRRSRGAGGGLIGFLLWRRFGPPRPTCHICESGKGVTTFGSG